MLLEEDKEAILRQNYYLNKYKDATIKARFLRDKHLVFLCAIFLNLLIFFFAYLHSSKSNLFKVTIWGNNLLKEEEIIKLSGVKEKAKFWFISTGKIKKRLLDCPLISAADIKKENNNILRIEIKERRLFGYFSEKGKTKLWVNGKQDVNLATNDLYLLSKIPLIVGFDELKLKGIEKHFEDLKDITINEISEIHHYPMTYDDNFLQVIMRDGNYVFLSPAALKYLNSYYNIASVLEKKTKQICLYFDEITKTGYSSACPWEKVKLKEEVKN